MLKRRLVFNELIFELFMIASELPPAFFTLSAHFCSSGFAAFFHSSTCAGVSE